MLTGYNDLLLYFMSLCKCIPREFDEIETNSLMTYLQGRVNKAN